MLGSFDFRSPTRVIFGEGALQQIGTLARELGFTRTLIVADRGLTQAGHTQRAHDMLNASAIDALEFSDFGPNPDADMIEAGRAYAASQRIDSLVGLGGGSSMDCAKGINFLLTQGGSMQDFVGYGKATQPMLPMIGVPTTAGTGSEAQSYAIISDPRTHRKMACGDPKAAFRAVVLDPCLTVTQPGAVTATAGYDAIAHAVETSVSTRSNAFSRMLSREAWRLLEGNYERVLAAPDDLAARAAMQLGAYYAGMAIELSMLGATHACANPLTARYGTTHGEAIAVMLPHIVRWNGAHEGARGAEGAGGPAGAAADGEYAELLRASGHGGNGNAAQRLAARLEALAAAGRLPNTLRAVGASREDLPALADDASEQWTGRFNPRPFDAAAAREVYEWAF
jgi:alcohol dehydrogenase